LKWRRGYSEERRFGGGGDGGDGGGGDCGDGGDGGGDGGDGGGGGESIGDSVGLPLWWW